MSDQMNESSDNADFQILVDQTKDGQTVKISNKTRKIIFVLMVLVAAVSSLDGGIVPQQLDKIKVDFEDEGEAKTGLFSSIDYLGRVGGALIMVMIINIINRKSIYIPALFIKGLMMALPIITENFIPNIVARFFTGFSQVIFTTYLPVWCDQYGKSEYKTKMVMLIQLGNPLGIIFGYGVGMLCDKILGAGDVIKKGELHGWRIGFCLEGIMLILLGALNLCFEKKYFSPDFVLVGENMGKVKKEKKTKSPIIIISNFIHSIPKYFKNVLFIATTFATSVSFFGLGVIQYYGEAYLRNVLGFEGQALFICYGSLCVLGPISGIIFGGLMTSKIGGYVKKKAIILCLILTSVGAVSAVSMGIVDNKAYFIAICLVYLFTIGAVIPPEAGITIASLENKLRGDGYSLCNLLLNLIGSFPAPFVFSLVLEFIQKKYKEVTKNYPISWTIVMCYNFIGILAIIISTCKRFNIEGDLVGEENCNIDNNKPINVSGSTNSETIEKIDE